VFKASVKFDMVGIL